MQPQFGGKEKSKNENGGTAWKNFSYLLTSKFKVGRLTEIKKLIKEIVWPWYLLWFWLHSEVEQVGDQSLLLSGGPKPCIFLHLQKHKTRWKAAIWFVKCILEFLKIRFDREASLVRSSWEAGEIAGGSMVLLLPWEAPGGLERDRGCGRRPSGDQQWRARASLDPGLDVVEPRGSEPAGRTSKAMSTWTTLCLELPWKLKSAYSVGQALKMFCTTKLDRAILSQQFKISLIVSILNPKPNFHHLDCSLARKEKTDAAVFALVLDQDPVYIYPRRPDHIWIHWKLEIRIIQGFVMQA